MTSFLLWTVIVVQIVVVYEAYRTLKLLFDLVKILHRLIDLLEPGEGKKGQVRDE